MKSYETTYRHYAMQLMQESFSLIGYSYGFEKQHLELQMTEHATIIFVGNSIASDYLDCSGFELMLAHSSELLIEQPGSHL